VVRLDKIEYEMTTIERELG